MNRVLIIAGCALNSGFRNAMRLDVAGLVDSPGAGDVARLLGPQ
jgi:hypothetical protein